MRKFTGYVTPEDFVCPDCGEKAIIVPLDNSFDYAGTHCTYGRSGIHYPQDYGSPVTACCEAPVEAEVNEPDIDEDVVRARWY